MIRTILFSDDDSFKQKLSPVISLSSIHRRVKLEPAETPAGESRLFIVDGDCFPHDQIIDFLHRPESSTVPTVVILNRASGEQVMELIKAGTLTVIFKSSSREKINGELRAVFHNIRQLSHIRESSVNEKILTAFLKTINTIRSGEDINDSMSKILKTMKNIFHFHYISLLLYSGDRAKEKISITGDEAPPGIDTVPEALNHAEIRRNLEAKALLSTGQVDTSTTALPLPSHSILLPIRSQEKLTGVIYCRYPPLEDPLSGNKNRILTILANYASVILENAKLYWNIMQTQDKLIREEKKSLHSQMIISLNHEINNPLSIISMQAQLIRKHLSPANTELDDRLDKVENNIHRIEKILDQISRINLDEDNYAKEYVKGTQMVNVSNEKE